MSNKICGMTKKQIDEIINTMFDMNETIRLKDEKIRLQDERIKELERK